MGEAERASAARAFVAPLRNPDLLIVAVSP